MGELVFFDVETTMPTGAESRCWMLEFGAILVCPKNLVEVGSYCTLIRPVDLSVVSPHRISGITREAVSLAPPFEDVADQIYKIMHGRVWVGHNIRRFDCPRLKEAYADIGRSAPEPISIIDSLNVLSQGFGRRAGDLKMATLASYFKIGPQKHRSLDDARMNLDVIKHCATVLFLESSLRNILSNNNNGENCLEGSSHEALMATSKAISKMTEENEGEWQVVSHRRRSFPENWRHGPEPQPLTTKPYTPHTSPPSYAQILTKNSPRMPNTLTSPSASPNTSPTTSPNFSQATTFYISPHSPTRLRFPPSPHFGEWGGHCFKCCRKGHLAAACKEGQLNPVVMPYWDATKPALPTKENPPPQLEPKFDDLLTGPYPHTPMPLPDGRPYKLYYFVDLDASYFNEIASLQHAVVMSAKHIEVDLSIDQVANLAAKTGLVAPGEIKVAILAKSCYLIKLPMGLAPETFIRATPPSLWDEGFSFQLWDPMEDASINIPSFKVLIDLHGIPPQLYCEREVIRAVSGFGTYLGTISQNDPADIACWTVVVATDDLCRIPQNIAMVVGGMEIRVPVRPLKWAPSPIYTSDDLPKAPPKFTKPPSPPTSSSSEDDMEFDDN